MENSSQLTLGFQLIKDRVNDQELTIDTLRLHLSSLETGLIGHEHRIQNNTNQIADVMSNKSKEISLELPNATIKELIENIESQGDKLLALEEGIKQLEAITGELSNGYQNMSTTLSNMMLKLMLNASNAENQTELESDFTAYEQLILGLAKDVSNIETNLTEDRTFQRDMLTALNQAVTQMGILLKQLNTSSLDNADMLTELEEKMEQGLNQLQSEMEADHINIENNTETGRLLEANMTPLKYAYEKT